MHRVFQTFVLLGFSLVLMWGSAFAQQAPPAPFAQREVKFENGTVGKPLTFESANPRNFEEIISKGAMHNVKLDGQLFVPPVARAPYPVVILVPGSGGVSPDHVKHAEQLTSAGLPVYVLDPFAGRGIKDTISDQGQFTWAASAYDILAVVRMLSSQPDVDGRRIGAVGYSRGGAAVLLAASQQMSRAVLSEGKALKAVLVGWPWCGYQFEHALTAPTSVRILVGDSDNWVSPVQCQGGAAAMAAKNPNVSIRFFKDAYHGFGYYGPIREIPNAVKSYNAPIAYINDQGSFLDWYTGEPLRGADDAQLSRIRAPWVSRSGVTVGTKPGQTEAFISDMVSFFREQLK